MQKKILFILTAPFFHTDYKRFGVDFFISKNYEIEIFNLCPIIYPLLFKNVEKKNLYDGDKEQIFFQKSNFYTRLKNNKSSKIIVISHYNIRTHFIYKALSRYNISYSHLLVNSVPSNTENNQRRRISNYFNFSKLRYVIENRIYNTKNFTLFNLKPPEYTICGGKNTLKNPQSFIRGEKTKLIWAHSFDYDQYLIEENKSTKLDDHLDSKKFIVFIDAPSPLVNHDSLIPNISSPLTAARYFPSLCKFFDFIEEKSGADVVIASHPKSNHSKNPDYFGNRNVYRDMTLQLIKHSELVINRNSTAINFAIMYNKPIIFHTTSEIEEHSVMRSQIKSMANLLNLSPINIDSNYFDIDLNNLLKVDHQLYAEYKNKYVKSMNSLNLPLWEIVLSELENSL